MAYTDSPSTAKRTSAISGVVIIHAAIGVALITGLASNFVPTAKAPPLEGGQIPLPPPPPKPDETIEPDAVKPPSKREIYIPPPPRQLPSSGPQLGSTPDIVPPSLPSDRIIPDPGAGFIPAPTPPAPPAPSPSPTLSLTPVQPAPANSQANWITTADYRTAWIRRGYAGTAGFRLTVGTDGRVSDCAITRSTGHDALDTATCKLATRRARFDAARDSKGEKTTGTFSSSVLWQIPE